MNIFVSAALSLALLFGIVATLPEEPQQNLSASIFQVQQGGTGRGTLTTDTLLTGNGTGAVNMTSIGSGLSLNAGVLSATGGSGGGIGTTSPWTPGQMSYVVNDSTVTGVSTTTLTASSPLSLSNPVVKVGGSNSVLSLSTAGDWTGTLDGLEAAAFQLAGNYITDLTGDITASGPGSAAATLATVNADVGSYTNANITVNAKGLVTAVSNGSAGGGGSSPIATSSQETATYIPYWSSTNATPATLSGGESTFTYDAALNKMTVANASTTELTIGNVTAALALTNAAGTVLEYAGTVCTNEFVRSLSAVGAATCAAIDLAADVSGILPVANGGTGWANIQAGAIPYGNGTNRVATTTQGTGGQILAWLGGIPTWTATTTFSGGLTYSGGNVTADLGTSIVVGELASADFGDWTCNGSACTIDAGVVSNADLANSTISGVALGSNLNALTNNATLAGSSYNGSAAISDWGLNLANSNAWTALQTFTNASSTQFSVGNAGTNVGIYFTQDGDGALTIQGIGNLSNENLILNFDDVSNSIGFSSGTGVTGFDWGSLNLSMGALTLGTDLTVANGGTGVSTLTGVVVGNGTSAFSAGVDGTNFTLINASTCTNQVHTAATAAGVFTCASINNAFWSGTDLSVANGGTGLSTFGGTNTILYTTAADTLSSEAAFTYSPTLDRLTVVNATTTSLSASQSFALSTLTSGRVPFASTNGLIIDNGNLVWDNTNMRLGVGSTTPQRNFVASSTAVVEATLTDAATITFDLRFYNQARVTITDNRTIDFTNETQAMGQSIRLVVCQDGSGSSLLTWDSAVRWAGGTAPTLTTTANKCDVIAGFTTMATGTPIIILDKILNI